MTLKVVHTNTDGLLLARLKLRSFLKEVKLGITGIVETELASEIDVLKIGDGEYNLWLRNRKGKQGRY